MSNTLDFGLWAPTEEVFWQSWQTAGIVTAPWQFTPEYAGKLILSTQTQQGWTPTKLTGNMVFDINGNLIPERIPVAGWHANVRVYDPATVAQFTWGRPQTDAQGNLLPLFDRTWAAEVFQLTPQEADPVTGFPAGMRNSVGCVYADPASFRSATNRWAS